MILFFTGRHVLAVSCFSVQDGLCSRVQEFQAYHLLPDAPALLFNPANHLRLTRNLAEP